MTSTQEMLFFLGQRAFWGLNGGVLALAFVQLRGAPPPAAPAASPEIHVHLAPTASAPAARAPAARAPEALDPATFPTALPPRRGKDAQAACRVARYHKGIYGEHFEGERFIDHRYIDEILENQPALMRSARIVPEKEDGKTVGIRLFGVRSDSLLGQLGFENGDRIDMINGFEIADPEHALEAYSRLRNSPEIEVLIQRRGSAQWLQFHIC